MIEIRKATITSGIFLAYEYNIQENNVSNKNKTQSTAPIHDDLRNAFKKLIPHFILLTEEMPEDKMKGIIENNLQLPEDEDGDQPFTIKGKFGGVEVEVSSSVHNTEDDGD